MTRGHVRFDDPARWTNPVGCPAKGYEIDIHPGDGPMGATIELTQEGATADYYFVQSSDDAAAFTPAYVIDLGNPEHFLDTGVYDLRDEHVAPWMRAAIERAGFAYAPVSNADRRQSGEESVDDAQATLGAEVTA